MVHCCQNVASFLCAIFDAGLSLSRASVVATRRRTDPADLASEGPSAARGGSSMLS